MNEQQSEHKCETTLSKLIKVLISQESWRKGAMQGARQFVEGIGVKGHRGVDQQRPVTSLKTRPEREVAWNLPRQLHGALPDRVGRVTGSWRYVWLLSLMYLRDILVARPRKLEEVVEFAIEPGRIGQIPDLPSFFSPSRGSSGRERLNELTSRNHDDPRSISSASHSK